METNIVDVLRRQLGAAAAVLTGDAIGARHHVDFSRKRSEQRPLVHCEQVCVGLRQIENRALDDLRRDRAERDAVPAVA